MKIAIIAPGSRGDIQPYVALGAGLVKSGHHVRIVTNMEFEELVRSYDLEFWGVDLDVQIALQSSDVRSAIEGGGLIRSFIALSRMARRGSQLLAVQGLEAARGMDAILSGFGGLFMAYSLAQKLNLPLIQAYNVPITPTREFAGALLPHLPFASVLNSFTHRLTRQILWVASRAAGNAARKTVLDLPSAPRVGPFESGVLKNGPVLYGISPSFLPKPKDWDKQVAMTGWWFADLAKDWRPDAELMKFLGEGPPPVFVGFGSMSHKDGQKTMELVLSALQISGQRGIVQAGWGGLKAREIPPNVFLADNIPHAWLFSKVRAVVHHGGAGTTAAGVRAGIPTIVVPFHGDQPFWGRRVSVLGIGPNPVPRKRLTARLLADAILAATQSEDMRARAFAMGAKVRGEEGVATAVEWIEWHANQPMFKPQSSLGADRQLAVD